MAIQQVLIELKFKISYNILEVKKLGGKIKNIFAVLLASLYIFISASGSQTIHGDDFIRDKEKLVLGSDIEIMYMVDCESMEITFKGSNGETIETSFFHNDESGFLETTLKPSQVGIYESQSVKVNGEEFYFDQLSFEVVESANDIFGEGQAPFLVDNLPSQVSNEDLVESLSLVKFYDEMGEALLTNVSLESPEKTYYFQTDSDGLIGSTTVFTKEDIGQGDYWASFSAGGKTYEKLISVYDSQGGDEGQMTLSTGLDQENLTRIGGADRAQTGVGISKYLYDKSQWAVLTNGDSYGDSLVAVSLSSAVDGPVLFSGKESLNPSTREELVRLQVSNVYLIGGDSAISPRVESQLEAMGINVNRISGSNSIDTANNLARELSYYSGFNKAILAHGDNFPDALAASPLAGELQIPILFTKTNAIDQSTLDTISDLAIKEILIVGGPNSVSENVSSQLKAQGLSVKRIGGSNRFETAIEFARDYYPGFDNVIVASGEKWPDAILGGTIGYKYKAPIVLTTANSNPPGVEYMTSQVKEGQVIVLGGTDTISQNVYNEIARFMPDKTSQASQATDQASQNITGSQAPKTSQDTTKESSNPTKPIRIFIDQGHGWRYNPGVVPGYYEGNAMYWYGLILRNNLRTYGFEVDCIRNDLEAERLYCIKNGLPNTNGMNVSKRGPLAKGYDLLLSCHTNAHRDPNVWGTEVFDSTQSPTYELAEELSAVIADHFGHNNRGVKYRYYNDGSVTHGRISDDQRGTDWYGVLRTSAAPRALMLEHGFHSNWHDCTKLMDADFKHEMAEKSAKVIADYFGYSK